MIRFRAIRQISSIFGAIFVTFVAGIRPFYRMALPKRTNPAPAGQALEDIMNKMRCFATLVIVACLAAGLQTATDARAGDVGVMPESRAHAIELPPDVAARVAALRAYGDRFDAAIKLIEAEAAKPIWGDYDCDTSDLAEIALVPTN